MFAVIFARIRIPLQYDWAAGRMSRRDPLVRPTPAKRPDPDPCRRLSRRSSCPAGRARAKRSPMLAPFVVASAPLSAVSDG